MMHAPNTASAPPRSIPTILAEVTFSEFFKFSKSFLGIRRRIRHVGKFVENMIGRRKEHEERYLRLKSVRSADGRASKIFEVYE